MPKSPVFTRYPAHVIERRSAVVLSGWWRRVFAACVDAVVMVLLAISVLSIGFAGGSPVAGVIGMFATVALYYVIGHGSNSGQTLGKKALGIAVRRKDGGRVSYSRALVRFLAVEFFNFLPIIGIIDVIRPWWNDMNRTYHDGIANTIVVRVR